MAPGDVPEQSSKSQRLRQLINLAVVLLLASFVTTILLPVRDGTAHIRLAKAKIEVAKIADATLAYFATYNRLPGSAQVLSSASPDFTFGTHGLDLPISIPPKAADHQANNSELLAVLMDLEAFRNGQPTVNVGHVRNPAKIAFFEAEPTSGPYPDIGPDGVYRDPWANPYIITLDIDGDGFCEDPLYGKVRGRVFVWSFGPDGKADPTVKPDEGVNADNIFLGEKTNSP